MDKNKFFTILNRNTPVICNIPHSSTRIPMQFKTDFLISHSDLRQEVKRMGDLFTNELYKTTFQKFGGIRLDVSRIVTDIERFEDDKKESMASVGMGALYTKTEDGIEMRKFDNAKRSKYLNQIYRQYHTTFEELVNTTLEKFGYCIILDCHSFPSKPRPYEPDQRKNRPPICLGTDKFHTPKDMETIFKKNFSKYFSKVKINSPFAGTLVPIKYYHKNNKIQSIMIEVNRDIYMHEKQFIKRKNFDVISRKINQSICKSIGGLIK